LGSLLIGLRHRAAIDVVSLPAYIIEPTDDSPTEVETRAEFASHYARNSLAGLILQGLRLDTDPPDLTAVDLTGTVFVGCRFASNDVYADLVRRGVQVVPAFTDLPYETSPSALYTPEDLAGGFAERGFEGMFDTVVYRHFVEHGGALPDVREALAQRVHDSAVDDGLIDATTKWISDYGAGSIVGIMGGHAEPRGSVAYRMAANLGWRLARAKRLIVTGGGPGVMEAANLGAYMSGRTVAELTSAIDMLVVAPDFHDHDPYTAAALAVRSRFPANDGWHASGGLSIPTWLYGHEPANLFAGRIAKYFSNAIREDTILRLARGGIVFAAGRAGTVQEVFQAATKTFYATDGSSGPYVFLDAGFWNGSLPAPELLRTLLASTPSGDQSSLVHVTDDIDEAVGLLSPRVAEPRRQSPIS
jgi:predicted Rossmann-fold nucleotide-binding protein